MIPALGGSPTLLSQIDGGRKFDFVVEGWETIYFEMKQNLYASDDRNRNRITKLTDFDETKPVNRDFNVSPDEEQFVYADKIDGQQRFMDSRFARNKIRCD